MTQTTPFSSRRKARDIMIIHEDWFYRGMNRKMVGELERCIEKCLEEAYDAGREDAKA